ncbi:unnamed protein product [Adineta ricciae]|uniref:Ig-like domain-containing protein n=1 Tax=Adineta ricciae TaxID=249248 RepID=A0A816D0H5_ADIRI|nr:unnamed protein product [Adineta ricciae]
MLGSYRLLILIKLILFPLFDLMRVVSGTFRRSSTENDYQSNQTTVVNSLVLVVSVSVNDYFAVINCSTPERVPHHKLDWYFQSRDASRPPRVIWQRGRSNIHRYIAYSPDQFRHFLQIKPVHYNDSGTYMCLDQTSGFYAGVDLFIRKLNQYLLSSIHKYPISMIDDNHNSAKRILSLPITSFMCLALLVFFSERYSTSVSQVT